MDCIYIFFMKIIFYIGEMRIRTYFQILSLYLDLRCLAVKVIIVIAWPSSLDVEVENLNISMGYTTISQAWCWLMIGFS